MMAFLWELWDESWFDRCLLFVVAAMIVSIPFVVYRHHLRRSACFNRGGEFVAVGHHQQLMPMYVGKTIILIPQQITDYACSVPERAHP